MRDKDSSSSGGCHAISTFRVFSPIEEGMKLEESPLAFEVPNGEEYVHGQSGHGGREGDKVIKMVSVLEEHRFGKVGSNVMFVEEKNKVFMRLHCKQRPRSDVCLSFVLHSMPTTGRIIACALFFTDCATQERPLWPLQTTTSF